MLVFFVALVTATWVVELKPGVNPADFARKHNVDYVGVTEVNENLHIFEEKTQGQTLKMTRDVEWLEEQVPRKRFTRAVQDWGILESLRDNVIFPLYGDPLRDQQWHLEMVSLPENCSFTGHGVTIGIVDDGLQVVHPEIYGNYDSRRSWNFNGGPKGSNDPSPVDDRDGHGTSAAAVAAGVRGNNHCGQGVAPNATLVGLRLIARPVTDLQESQALSKYFASVDIYSNSWGPEDSGHGLDAPGRLVRETFAKYAGASIGRNGKGTVYVWAAGNGHHHQDSCAFDGYAGNPYVNAIGAVDHTGDRAYYSEGCSNLLAVTPSSGDGKAIVTADLLGPAGYTDWECTKTFGGTSSAAPLAAGIFALMLEKRPDLGWRDLRHVVATATGGRHNNSHGFGLLNVEKILKVLDNYEKVPRKQKQIFSEKMILDAPIGNRLEISMNLTTNATLDFIENAIVIVTVLHPNRGQVRISLVNPSGDTTSVLAEERDGDNNADFVDWPFSSLAFWGQTYNGSGGATPWKVVVESRTGGGGVLKELKFGLFGF